MSATDSLTPRRFVSLRVAAEALDLHPRTIRRRISDGTITGYRVSGATKVDLNEVEAKLIRPMRTAALAGDAR